MLRNIKIGALVTDETLQRSRGKDISGRDVELQPDVGLKRCSLYHLDHFKHGRGSFRALVHRP